MTPRFGSETLGCVPGLGLAYAPIYGGCNCHIIELTKGMYIGVSSDFMLWQVWVRKGERSGFLQRTLRRRRITDTTDLADCGGPENCLKVGDEDGVPDLVCVSLGALPELELFRRNLAVLDVNAEVCFVSPGAGAGDIPVLASLNWPSFETNHCCWGTPSRHSQTLTGEPLYCSTIGVSE